MNAAIEALPAFAPFRESMRRYFADAAAFLINHSELPTISEE